MKFGHILNRPYSYNGSLDSPKSNEAHLWWAFPDRIRDPEILDRQFAVLSKEERRKLGRFVFERHRLQYLVSHSLVRDVLSRYAPVPPAHWRFDVNQYGRPSIAWPTEWRDLRFNLSHTDGRAVVAVGWAVDIGVDVEATNPKKDLPEVADRFFSPLEVAELKSAPERFFDFWTLKEAYMKARGMGLAIPLDSFSFILTSAESPQIVFHEGCADRPERWQFELAQADDHRRALAVATAGSERLLVREHEIVPMAR